MLLTYCCMPNVHRKFLFDVMWNFIFYMSYVLPWSLFKVDFFENYFLVGTKIMVVQFNLYQSLLTKWVKGIWLIGERHFSTLNQPNNSNLFLKKKKRKKKREFVVRLKFNGLVNLIFCLYTFFQSIHSLHQTFLSLNLQENFRREGRRGSGGTFWDSVDVVELKKLMTKKKWWRIFLR